MFDKIFERVIEENQTIEENIPDMADEMVKFGQLDRKQAKALKQEIQSGNLPNTWPTEPKMRDEISKVAEVENLNKLRTGELRSAYVRHILLPKVEVK